MQKKRICIRVEGWEGMERHKREVIEVLAGVKEGARSVASVFHIRSYSFKVPVFSFSEVS